jgi:ABC-type Na+ efflux pump permease subunit
MSIGIYASVFAFQSLIREKSRGNIQALLATPLEPGNICTGKSLAVFLPGLVFSEIITLAALLAINFIFIMPDISFVVTPWMIVSSFILVPLIYLILVFMVYIIGLSGKPATGNVIAQIFLPVIVTLMINLAVRDIPGAGTWLFAVILLGIAAVLVVITLKLRSRLTAERIVLSQ